MMPAVSPKDHLLAIRRTSERHQGRRAFICLDRNERVSPIAEPAFRDMLAHLTVQDLMSYPDAGPFVSRLADELGLPEDHIAETAGSDAAIRRLFMAYLRPGRTVITLNPSYAMYEIYTRIFQGVIKRIEYLDDRRCDVDALLAAIEPGVGIVIFAHPDQPSGTVISVADVRRIAGKSAAVGALCAVDEAYHPFHSVTAVPLVRELDNLVVTRSFSKYPGCAGMRLGYAVAKPALIQGLMAVRGGHEVSALSLACGCSLLDHPEIADEFRVAVERGRELLLAGAGRLGLQPLPCQGNFQLLRCVGGLDPQAVADGLERHGYLVKAGFDHPSLKGCIRISLNGPDVMQPFIVALDRVVEELHAGEAPIPTAMSRSRG